MKRILAALVTACWAATILAGDWPMLRCSPEHSGQVEAQFARSFHLDWAVEISDERLGTAVEPIVSGGTVFIGTHAGNLYALDKTTGQALWHFAAPGPFLQSPAVADGLVIAANAGGAVYALKASDGTLVWSFAEEGGFSAAPIFAEGAVFLGSRSGNFFALDLATGHPRWQVTFGVPIRQTAAWSDRGVFVTGEDLVLRCFDAERGELVWKSDPLYGQTARDYYPVIASQGTNRFVIVRTNPLLNMGQRIGRDRALLVRNAGIDDSNWQKIEAWTRSDAARGSAELWEKESGAIREYFDANPDAETFAVFGAQTGLRTPKAPVLWIGGCQGVGPMPAQRDGGELVVFYRSAYGNWNQGVAPLVSLGALDLGRGRVTPFFHAQGRQPPWNSFWGTADESQNFLVAGQCVFMVHQGTLSGFDLRTSDLFPIWGNRDTYGGYRNPPWARNEWHGPARSGLAISDDRIFWQTGSRILCLRSGAATGQSAPITTIRAAAVRTVHAPPPPAAKRDVAQARLGRALDEFLAQNWAPVFTDPGLSGRDFSFDESVGAFEAVTAAWPLLDSERQARVQKFLDGELARHPPFAAAGQYPLNQGRGREWFQVPDPYRTRLGADPRPHPFGGLASAWRWVLVTGSSGAFLTNHWPEVKDAFTAFEQTHWQLNPDKGDLFANRYVDSLRAFVEIAERSGHPALAARARAAYTANLDALVRWWRRAGQGSTVRTFQGSAELDPFITRGDALSFRVAPHRHKIALFCDLSPELFREINQAAPEAVAQVWAGFDELYRTWHLQGEERQVHFGENFIDPPDLARNAFKLFVWLKKPDFQTALHRADLPFCRADLYFIEKLALAFDLR